MKSRRKLFEGIKSSICHKLTSLQIDDLIDNFVIDKHFNQEMFKEFLKDDLIEQEEDEFSLVRILELFKQNTLLSFTSSSIGKEIPSLATNHVYDKFSNEYNCTMHNEFHTRLAKTTSFFISVFLSMAKTDIQKEEVIKALTQLQNEIENDQAAELKFFTIFSIVDNLKKIITKDRNYDLFLKSMDSYLDKMKRFVRDSPFTVYLLRENIMELSDVIVTQIIDSEAEEKYKKIAIITIFKLASCFKILDLHLEFITQIVKHDYEYNMREDFTELIEEIFSYSFGNVYCSADSNLTEKITISKEYGCEILNVPESSYTTDGTFIYIHQKEKGMFKIGTGRNETIEGKVYMRNEKYRTEADGSLAYADGKLYYRAPQTKPLPFVCVDKNSLQEIPIEFSVGQEKYHFVDEEATAVDIPYKLSGHQLKDQNRSSTKSRLISDGRYLYLISKVGELNVLEKANEGIYPGNCLINVDIFDPLHKCEYITSIPLTDPKGILAQANYSSNFATEAIINDVVTDGNLLLFANPSGHVTYNMISRCFTQIDVSSHNNYRHILDPFNSKMINFLPGDSNQLLIFTSKIPVIIINKELTGTYLELPSFLPCNIKSHDLFSSTTSDVVVGKEKEIYDTFVTAVRASLDQKSEDKGYDKWIIASILLKILSQGSKMAFNISEVGSSPLGNVFSSHVLNFKQKSIQKLFDLYQTLMETFKANQSVESEKYIISSLLSLLNCHMHRIKTLQFPNLTTDYAFLKGVIEDSMCFARELIINGDQFKGLTTDLISQSLQIIENYSTLFGIDHLSISMLEDIMPRTSPVLSDLKYLTIRNISKNPNISSGEENIKSLCRLLEMILERNNNLIIDQIEKIASSSPTTSQVEAFEYEKEYENIISSFLKGIFESFYQMSAESTDEKEKEKKLVEFQMNVYKLEKVIRILLKYTKDLFTKIDSIMNEAKISSLSNYDRISKLTSEALFLSSASYRLSFSTILLLHVISKEKFVIFKFWHHFFDLLLLFDKSFQANKKEFLKLLELDEMESKVGNPFEKFDWVLETSHPVTKQQNAELHKTFNRPYDIHVEFDPFSKKEGTFKILAKSESGDKEEIFENGLKNIILKNVKEIDVSFETSATNSYGIKVHIHNKRKFIHIFDSIFQLTTSIVINSFKTFFFFDYSRENKTDFDLENMLQAKLFSGGIDELLDLEASSEDYQNFLTVLKENENYKQYERRLFSREDNNDERERLQFEFEDILNKKINTVEKFIECAQIVLKPRFPWINVGGENANSIVRGAFAVMMKQESLYGLISFVAEEIADMEKKRGNKQLTLKELSSIENFDYLVLIWSEVSRLRQWYMEQIKDIAEANSKEFDKQNEDFVRSIVDKCHFLFQFNAPTKTKGKMKTDKIKFLEAFAKNNDMLSNQAIESELVKANIIQFKKNLMQRKIDEGTKLVENAKRNIQTVVNCIKLTKFSIENMKKALRDMNTKAKFREITLSLINAILSEVQTTDTKLFIVKQIIQTLRLTTGKRLGNIDDEIKSASPSILSRITYQFHQFLRLIFGGLLASDSVYYITSFTDCLFWNYKARDHIVLNEIGIFENLFMHSPNEMIKEAWNMITKLKLKSPYHRSTFRSDFSIQMLGSKLLELFHILSTTIACRVIDETHVPSDFNEESCGFYKKKSTIFDTSFDKLIEMISTIIQKLLEDYMEYYIEMIKNVGSYKSKFLSKDKFSEEFPTAYFDETFLTVFLLLVYKFNVNHSPLIIKYMKNPEFLSSLLMVLRYTSTKNKHALVNILKVYLNDLNDEDIQNMDIFLKKKELLKKSLGNSKFYSKDIESIPPRKFICLYLMESLYILRKGIHEKAAVTLTYEYEEGIYIINLLRFMYTDPKWQPVFDEVFIEHLSNFKYSKDTPEAFGTISQILSVLNGDCDEIHYGSKVLLKYKNDFSTSITEMYKDKVEEIDSCETGYVIGFCQKESKVGDLKTNKDVKQFLFNNIHCTRAESDAYILLITIEKDTYSKSKLKSNGVEFQTKSIQDVILCPEIDITINNTKLIHVLLEKFNDLLTIISNNEGQTLYELYMFNQMAKTVHSVFNEGIKEFNDMMVSIFSVDKIKQLIGSISKEKYVCKRLNQMQFMNMLKFYLNSKTTIGFELHEQLESLEFKSNICCEAIKAMRSIRLYNNFSYNGKILQILSSNISIDSESFSKINKLKPSKFGDSKLKNYFNCLLLINLENDDIIEKISKVEDKNLCLLLSKKDSDVAKEKIQLPYIALNNGYEELEEILNNLELKPKEMHASILPLESFDHTSSKIIDKIRSASFITEEAAIIKYLPSLSINPKEIVQDILRTHFSMPKNVTKLDFQNTMQKLMINYLRFFVIKLIVENPSLIAEDNYDFISKQFKIVYTDTCQHSNITIFSYKKFNDLMSLLVKIIDKEELIKPNESLININKKSKIFNSFNFQLKEKEICENLQSELIDFFYEHQLFKQANNLNIDVYLSIILKVLGLAIITINYESKTFIQYLEKLLELISKLFSFIASNSEGVTQEKVGEIVSQMRKNGLDSLFIYLSDSLKEEKKDFSIRTKKLMNFTFEFSKLYMELFKKVWNISKTYSFEDLPDSQKLIDALYNIHLLLYKAKYGEMKDRSILQSKEVLNKLSSSVEIPYRNLTSEVNFDFKGSRALQFSSNMIESKGKLLAIVKLKENGQYRIESVAQDIDISPLQVQAGKRLLIGNSADIKHELWFCGYNECYKLGNSDLSNYTNYGTPQKAMIDKDIKIQKVYNLPSSELVITTDGKAYVAGSGTNSGIDASENKTFTLDNIWNQILKKEKFVDFAVNENSGSILVTNKGIWVSGYNDYNCFGELCSSGSNTSRIVSWGMPFLIKKVCQVALGFYHTMWTLDDGTLYGVGCNNENELMLPTRTTISSVTKINLPNGLKCKKLSCGVHTSIFIMKERDGSNRLYSCGYNCYGQNGQGNSSDGSFGKCTGVEDLQFRFAKIGYYSCCAISTENKLYTWGYCGYQNLAQPDTNNKYQPTESEFFSGKTVLEADINNYIIVVKALDTDGILKLWIAGYNSSGIMSNGECNYNYYITPLEITAFKDAFISSFSVTGNSNAISYVISNINVFQNPFQFKCAQCNLTFNTTMIIHDKKFLCMECFQSKEELKVVLGIRGCEIKDPESLALPDLTEINKHEIKNPHGISCYECTHLISNRIAYIVADTISTKMVSFCENCYPNSSYFETPKFVYLVKGEMDYSLLPTLSNGNEILGFTIENQLKLTKTKELNEEGKLSFFKESGDLIAKVYKEYDDIRPEVIMEYIKVIEIDPKKVTPEELKKNPVFSQFSTNQIEIIDKLVTQIDAALKEVRFFVNMTGESMIKEIFISNLPFMTKASRMSFLEKFLYEDGEGSNCSISVRFSRGKSIKFKQKRQIDYQGQYTLFGQAFQKLKSVSATTFKAKKNYRLFCAELVGEGASDAGGPYREMMNNMMEELHSPWLDLFVPTPNNKSSSGQDREKWTINPEAKSITHLEMFTFLGRLFGFAARSLSFLNLNLPSFIWKQILEQPLDIYDLEKIDIHTANFLSDLMNLESKGITKEQFEFIYDQQFTTMLSNGKEVEVQANGKNEKVTFENHKEYARLALKTRFEECQVQIEAIKTGLFEIIKKEICLFINWKDLDERICGNLVVDVELLKKNTTYDGWSITDQLISWFWQAFNKFSNEERILYLKFVWGRSRLPLSNDGFDRQHRITRMYSSHSDISLPQSHTCFFTIDIPPYSSFDILYNKLLYAVKFCNEIDNDYTPSTALEEL